MIGLQSDNHAFVEQDKEISKYLPIIRGKSALGWNVPVSSSPKLDGTGGRLSRREMVRNRERATTDQQVSS